MREKETALKEAANCDVSRGALADESARAPPFVTSSIWRDLSGDRLHFRQLRYTSLRPTLARTFLLS
jgi:hypothetical protein